MHVLNREHATEIETPALTHGLECQVRRIQLDALRTGRTLTTEEALAELDKPTKRDGYESRVRAILTHGCFGPRVFERVFEALDRDGTVTADPVLEQALTAADMAAIDDCLPGVSAWQWGPQFGGYHGDDRWAGSEGVAGLAVRGKRVGFGTWANTEND